MLDNLHRNAIAFYAIMGKEVHRFARIWLQTIVPPAMTMALYLVVFGQLVGSRLQYSANVSYVDYIAPGLLLMSVMTNAYANVVSSFFSAKFQGYIEELLVAPIPTTVLVLGYVSGGVVRGICVSVAVMFVAWFFTDLSVAHPVMAVAVLLLTCTVFSLAGLINGIYAKSFDDTSIVPTFILTPLTYLGGIFYPVAILPEPWRQLSVFNPILYMINAMRYAFTDMRDVSVAIGFGILLVASAGFFAWACWLIHRGTGLRR